MQPVSEDLLTVAILHCQNRSVEAPTEIDASREEGRLQGCGICPVIRTEHRQSDNLSAGLVHALKLLQISRFTPHI